jgi:hypothetical protein
MPISIYYHARAKHCKKVRGKYFSGWCTAKQDHYFGWKLYLIYDIYGILMRFMILPTRPHKITAVNSLTGTMLFGAIILGNRGYIMSKDETPA